MKKLNIGEWIAIGVGLGLITYLFFSGPLTNFFQSEMQIDNQAENQNVTVREVTIGTGEIAEPGDIITAHYVGTLADGRVFDSSRDRGVPISFTLGVGQVIKGWDEGLQGMRSGGKRVLIISPEYGYGAQAVGPIPGNSTLTFEVELVDVAKNR